MPVAVSDVPSADLVMAREGCVRGAVGRGRRAVPSVQQPSCVRFLVLVLSVSSVVSEAAPNVVGNSDFGRRDGSTASHAAANVLGDHGTPGADSRRDAAGSGSGDGIGTTLSTPAPKTRDDPNNNSSSNSNSNSLARPTLPPDLRSSAGKAFGITCAVCAGCLILSLLVANGQSWFYKCTDDGPCCCFKQSYKNSGHRASKKESTIVAPAGSIHTAASLMSPITNSGFRNATGSDTEDGVPVLKHVTIDSQDNNSSTAGGTSDGAGEPQGEPHGAINGGGTSANRSAAPAVKAQTEASAPDLASAALAHKGGGSPNTPVNSSADAAVASSNVTANSAFLLDGDGAAEPESEPAPFVSQNSVVVGGVVYGEGPGTGLEGLSRSFSSDSHLTATPAALVTPSGAAGSGAPSNVERDRVSNSKTVGMDTAAAKVYVDGGAAAQGPPAGTVGTPYGWQSPAAGKPAPAPAAETPYGWESPAAPMVSTMLLAKDGGEAAPPPKLLLGSPRQGDDQYTSDAV